MESALYFIRVHDDIFEWVILSDEPILTLENNQGKN